ncbi:MAG: aspartate carbamoyltransferase catalytic subunit, partial [Actinomycetota bacterium]|nr:aspartate carbamoyltransferase catalytic subunit [Actinomycetota bacterium]
MTLHFRSIEEAGTERIHRLLDLTEHMAAVGRRPNPKVPALRGKTVCNLFFEDSTRTRMSFDLAAKRLSADTMTLAVSSSSVNKGESLRDTVETLDAMGVDAFVVRHWTSGVPWQVAGWTPAAVINAGDGWHAHPTQALLDAYTIRQRRGIANDFSGLKVAVVGDIRHSRVARSTTEILQLLGAKVVHVAPRTLLPPTSDVATTSNFDDVVGEVDVVYMLRMQRERMGAGLVPNGGEYSRRFALDERRA